MRFFLATLLAVLHSAPAFALSCARPDPLDSYNHALRSNDTYVVMLGDFMYPEPPQPDGYLPMGYELQAQFTGQVLGLRKFVDGFQVQLTVVVSCISTWCGQPPATKGNVLAFVRRNADRFVLSAGPCAGDWFLDPSTDTIRAIEICHRNGGC